MRRDMAFFLGLLLACAPMGVHALGLGEVKVDSALNEELDAELGLVSPSPAELETLDVSIASREAFDRYGLDRPVEVSNLEFEIKQRPDGTHYIQVTSAGVIREPFLTFLVEAKWASGRLLREYTVLLDPPVYADDREEQPTEKPAVAAESAPEREAEPAEPESAETAAPPEERQAAAEPEQVQAEPAAEPEVTTRPLDSGERAGAAEPEEEGADRGTYGPIERNETLWSIASRLRPEGVSVNQMMLALYRANPDAFGGNINHLKRGRILRIPEQGEMNSIARGQATSEVREQNREWQARTAGAAEQRSAVADADAGETEERDRLRIVAPEDEGGGEAESEGAGTGGDAENVAELRDELADARERAEDAESTNTELQNRIANLEAELEDAERLLSVQDDELAALQQEQTETGTGSETAPEEEADPEEEAAPGEEVADAGEAAADEETGAAESGESVLDEPVVAGEEATEQPAEEETAAGDESLADTETADEAAKDSATPAGEGEQAPAEETAAAETDEGGEEAAGDRDRSRPVVKTTTREPSLIESLLDPLTNPLIGGGLALLLLVAVVALILVRRKRREKKVESAPEEIFAGGDWEEESADESEPVIGETDTRESEYAPGDTTTMSPGVGGEGAEEADEFGETAVMERPAEATQSASTGVDESDPVSEADFHMAYGLYDEAAERLEKGIQEEPGRRELKTKLLEVHFAAGNRDEFVNTAQQLRGEMGDTPDDDWNNVAIMGRQIAPDEDLFSEESSGGGSVDFDMGESGGEAEGESEFGDIFGESAGTDESPESPESGPAGEMASPESEEAESLDFDIGDIGGESGTTEESAPEAESGSAGSEEEGGTLEPDFGESLDFDVSGGEGAASGEPAESEPSSSGTGSESKEDEGMDFDLGDFDVGGETGGTGETSEAGASGGEESEESTGADSQTDFDKAFEELSQYVDTNTSEERGGEDQGTEGETAGRESSTGTSSEEDLDLGDLSFGESETGSESTGDTGGDEEVSFGEDEEEDEEGDVGEIDTKLDLARAYIDMGDADGAKSILEEVVEEGDDKQKGEAKELLDTVS